jgi:GTP-binding protein EngB required for normal cell division
MEPAMSAPSPVRLNENQIRHLRVSCQYIDKLLADAAAMLAPGADRSPFSRYIDDLTPVQKRVFRDYVERIRQLMLQILETQGVEPGTARVSVLHALRTMLGFVEIAAEELKPRYMRGYGEVPEGADAELSGIAVELQGVARELELFLARGGGGDLQGRIARLSGESGGAALLDTLGRIIATHGLVEFRPALALILDRLEEQRFEVAVFGRVSTGKSSLLNHVIGTDRLPIGVTPITAVPTRITYGSAERLGVWFAERKMEWAEPARIAEFTTEDENPGNAKHVTRLVLEVPSPRLREGVVLVDTPGLGSLATEGAAETLAYLPRCDYAVVLVDAASSLTVEDVGTVRRLLDAGIPVSVLLSKADMLADADLDRLRRYVSDRLEAELGATMAVRPISVMPDRVALLEGWRREDLQPLIDRHRELAAQSIARKIGVLRENVTARLRGALTREARRAVEPASEDRAASALELRLRTQAGELERVRRECESACEELRRACEPVLALAARTTVATGAVIPEPAWLAAIEAAGRDRADFLQRALNELGQQARATLVEAARQMDLPAPELDEDVAGRLRELPRLAAPSFPQPPSFHALYAFGAAVARWRVAGWLHRRAADVTQAALDAYAAVLRDWSLAALARLRVWYLAHADGLAAQLGPGRLSGESAAAIREDLAALERERS